MAYVKHVLAKLFKKKGICNYLNVKFQTWDLTLTLSSFET